MKITVMPKQTAAELLLFMAEHENFSSIEKFLGEGVSTAEAASLLREVSKGLMQEANQELKDVKFDVKSNSHLTTQTKNILSYLSPYEEKTLLEAFGLTEKK